jgi:nicotinate-nucleotide adenylyltransferase
VGVLGGSFDPPHRGHMTLARRARRQLGLEKVLLLPCHTPPHGKVPRASALDRFAMCVLAAAPYAWMEACPLEVESGRKMFTVDSLRLLSRNLPGAGLVFLMGEDSLRDLPHWKNPRELLQCYGMAVLPRRSGKAVSVLPSFLREHGGNVVTLRGGLVRISSTRLRARPDPAEIPPAVYRYILKKGLYGATKKTARV